MATCTDCRSDVGHLERYGVTPERCDCCEAKRLHERVMEQAKEITRLRAELAEAQKATSRWRERFWFVMRATWGDGSIHSEHGEDGESITITIDNFGGNGEKSYECSTENASVLGVIDAAREGTDGD